MGLESLTNNEDAKPPVAVYFQVENEIDGIGCPFLDPFKGLFLPVRKQRPIEGQTPRSVHAPTDFDLRIDLEDAVEVTTEDLVEVLRRAGNEAAAEWFQNEVGERGVPYLLFDASEGRLFSVEAKERFFPE